MMVIFQTVKGRHGWMRSLKFGFAILENSFIICSLILTLTANLTVHHSMSMTQTIIITFTISCLATGFGNKQFVYILLSQVSLTNNLHRTSSLRTLTHMDPCLCQLYLEVTRQQSPWRLVTISIGLCTCQLGTFVTTPDMHIEMALFLASWQLTSYVNNFFIHH